LGVTGDVGGASSVTHPMEPKHKVHFFVVYHIY
jgi:desulfoferrodoxin (superoxide reductase-like protein)